MCTCMQTNKKKKEVKVKKSGTLKLLVSLINMWIIRSRESRRADQSTPCCRFNIFAHIKKKKKHIAHFKKNMIVWKVKVRQMNEGGKRGSTARGGEMKLRWERDVSDEKVSGRVTRKLFATGCIEKKKRSFGQFSLDVKTLIRVSESFSELCLEKMWFLLNSVQIHKNMEAKKERQRRFQSYSVAAKQLNEPRLNTS